MNDEELKEHWEDLLGQGLRGQSEDDILNMIRRGTSEATAGITRKLFRDMAITGGACIFSIMGVVFFYALYDPDVHTQIDTAKLVPVQLLGFVIFSILFLFGWLEYKLVDRPMSSAPLKNHLSDMLEGFKKYSRAFMATVVVLLFVTFYLELDYFITGNGILWLWPKLGLSSLLTTLSAWGIRRYFRKAFGSYLKELSGYLKQC